MKTIIQSLRTYLVLTVLLGLAYPFLMTGLAQALFEKKAQGSFVKDEHGRIVGSLLIAQKFESPKYFWPRPSSQDYNPMPSGGSNWGPTSQDLKKLVDERRTHWMAAHGESKVIPGDLLFASASGLDPQISLEAANYQIERVAQARGMQTQQVQDVVKLMTQGREFGMFGEPTVNVLALNLALDKKALAQEQ